jgi:23S rRNA pseudouridine2605 synthase
MRLNQYIAASTQLSRRAADQAIADGRVSVNGHPAELGQTVSLDDQIVLDSKKLKPLPVLNIALNKPEGYITSRRKQGQAPTIYELLPPGYGYLNPVGRLDKESSGLLILTNNGQLAHKLAHPSAGKWKEYLVTLDRPLQSGDFAKLQAGVDLEDGISLLEIAGTKQPLTVRLQEGRNRQIRRTFAALGYNVATLHRTKIGKLTLGSLKPGEYCTIKTEDLL